MPKILNLDAYTAEPLAVRLEGRTYRFRALSFGDALYFMQQAEALDAERPDPEALAGILNRVLDLLVEQEARTAFEALALAAQFALIRFLVQESKTAASVVEAGDGEVSDRPPRRSRTRR
jgi:hypothetical protein